MLGFVSEDKYNTERDARMRAEGAAETLRERITFLEELLERFLKRELNASAETSFKEMTPEQIMSVPAVGRREILQRQARADAAVKRDEQNEIKRNHNKLTPEEKEAVKKTLAVGAS